jgi:hypothetical protein
VTSGLRSQLQHAIQAIYALYVSLAGGVDRPMPQHLRRTFADAASAIIARVAFTSRDELRELVRQALAMGARDAAVSAAVTAALAAGPGRPEVEDWVQQIIGTLTERIYATVAAAQALPQILQPADAKTVAVIISRLHQAVNIADRDTRWAVNAGYNQGVREATDDAGIARVWVAERDACLHCLAYSGEVVGPGQPYRPDLTYYVGPDGTRKPLKQPAGLILWGPPLHPNCVPAGTSVSGPPVEIAYRRWHVGELVELRTESGRVLSVTPNHPVLTPQGWVEAGRLAQGAYIVCARRGESLALGPHEHHQPTLIEQVFSAARVTLGVSSVRVPVAAEHFHGDGVDGEVDVVATSRFLDGRLQVGQPLQQQALVGAGSSGLSLARQSGLFEQVRGAGPSGDPPSAGHRAGQVLLGGFVGGDDAIGFSPSADLDTSTGQGAMDRRPTDSVGGRELYEALASFVAPDEVVEIRRHPFAGHVYNLQTTDGWYTANGIVTHNCRCSTEPYEGSLNYPVAPWEREETTVAQALKREAERAVLRGDAGVDSQPALVRAAGALLARGSGLPVTVQRRARKAVRAGRFR